MRSQFSNRQKLNSIKQELANYIQNVWNENDRLYSLIAKDQFWFAQHDYDNYRKENFKDNKVIVKRQWFNEILAGKYDSPTTVCLWINKLMTLGLISKNPTSSLSAIKGIYKPTPDTHYFINEEKLIDRDTRLLEFG